MDWLRAAVAAVVGLFVPAPMPEGLFFGYAEGEYAHLAPREAGTLRRLAVARGDTVRSGTVVAVLDGDSERASLDEARARLTQSEAQLDNLRTGRRTPEIDALVAQKAQADAALRLSEAQYRRQSQLPAGQVVSVDRIDQARAAFERDRGRVAELTAQIAVARLAARDDEIEAAEAAVAMAGAAMRQAQWKLDQRTLAAPADGLVADTLFVPGEFVTAGATVVQLLPAGNIRLRFFVPEPMLARLAVGRAVAVGCDGCAPGLTARIGYISPRAEFTPPVIYSRETRAKLVFMVEAKPDAPASFHPGQPVEVRLQP